MLENIKMEANRCPKSDCSRELSLMSAEEIRKVRAFHKSFPQYSETPLVKLDALAQKLGVKGVYVKDESYRFGLGAFKVLGGSFAIAKYIAKLIGCDVSKLTYDRLTSKELRDRIGRITFFSATDGNHGRGVAWAANRLGQKAVIYMPAGSTQMRLDHIRREGAEASIIDGNYDDAVRLAAAESARIKNSVVVQDTAWEGYEEIPGWIMQGYGTMSAEADEQLKAYGDTPTHVFAQAGVGSFAGAVQGYFTNVYGGKSPRVSVVEAQACDCLYRSAKSKEYTIVEGDTRTIMAGLNCGSPSTISWEILKNHTEFFFSCPDWVSAKGMRILSSPLRGDTRVISGESGAVGAGLLAALMSGADGDLDGFRQQLGLDKSSVVLLFSTEGDTDPGKYEDIVWDGEYASLMK